MSRNSKTASRLIAARKRSAERKNGNKGPAQTTPKHGKKRAWWQVAASYSEWVKGPKKQRRDAPEDGPV